MEDMMSCVWLLLLGIKFLRFIHIVDASTSVLLIVEKYAVVQYITSFLHSPADEHVCCFQFGAVRINAAMNIRVLAFVNVGFHFSWVDA